ncbi:MAG: YdiU family protein [Chitinivibrionales bacterium]|nr:YdiU family protein [Chitinivibrionales bacterium]
MDIPVSGGWRFDTTYLSLPQTLFVRQSPCPVEKPRLLVLNYALAQDLGLDIEWLCSKEGVQTLAGNSVVPGSEPIAQAYAGHQFGHFTMLGDGRAILLGEHITPDGRRFDIQLKGSGRTPFSRDGDGRAAVGPMMREYLISEAMHFLGIPTTRSLAVVATGEKVRRERQLDGAVLVRVASSHIRVGTFEFAAAGGDSSTLRKLLDYTIVRHYPDLLKVPSRALAFLECVMDRQAELIARWMHVGFVHGVMNTDNMALSGETIDYGPCAFMDSYNPATVFSSIDTAGRYAFGNQPAVAQWNLARFAETLLPFINPDDTETAARAEEVIDRFPQHFRRFWLDGMLRKVGIKEERPGDDTLVESFLGLMQRYKLDYTETFRMLATAQETELAQWPAQLEAWRNRWIARVEAQPDGREEATGICAAANPAVIPRNHLVEETLAAVVEENDFGPLNDLLDALAHPYESGRSAERYEKAPEHPDPNYRTFCGT